MGSLELDTTERLHFHFSLSFIGEGNGNPLQCSCLENPRDREAWWAAVYGVAQSRTQLKWLSSSSSSSLLLSANAYLFLLLILRNNVLHFILFTTIHCFNDMNHFQSQKNFWNLYSHRINLLIFKKKKRNLKHKTYFKLMKFMCLVSLGHSRNGVSERIRLTFSEMISIFKTNQYREHMINSQSFSTMWITWNLSWGKWNRVKMSCFTRKSHWIDLKSMVFSSA